MELNSHFNPNVNDGLNNLPKDLDQDDTLGVCI